jgi:hypothetical protein
VQAAAAPEEEPEPESEPDPPEEPPEEPPDQFASLISQLAGAEQPAVRPTTAPRPGTGRLSADIEAAVRARLKPCWSVDPAAADPIVVEVQAVMSQDGRAMEAVVTDQARMASDPRFAAAARAALSALRNPRCQPLPLPPGQYQDWRNMTLIFDPEVYF